MSAWYGTRGCGANLSVMHPGCKHVASLCFSQEALLHIYAKLISSTLEIFVYVSQIWSFVKYAGCHAADCRRRCCTLWSSCVWQ